MVKNTSTLHGPRNSRAGYELIVVVLQALQVNTQLHWVAGAEMIADALTKALQIEEDDLAATFSASMVAAHLRPRVRGWSQVEQAALTREVRPGDVRSFSVQT